MFYEILKIPQGIFKACIIPRPIAWISTQNKSGHLNLAPFSYFNIVCENPAMIMFSTTNTHTESGPKDTLKNIEETQEFVVNIATFEQKEAINSSSADLPRDQSEFEFANVLHTPSTLIKVPRVKDSPISLECILHQTVQLPTHSPNDVNRMVIGKVLGVHINPAVLTNGLIDIKKLKPIARLGYHEYAVIGNENDIFSMKRPEATDLVRTTKATALSDSAVQKNTSHQKP